MPTLRDFADQLQRLHAYRDVLGIATLLDFDEPLPLDAAGRRHLGLDARVRRAAVAAGAGTLRFLAIDAALGDWTRAELAALCRTVALRAPHLLWLVVVVTRDTRAVVLAAPSASPRVPVLRIEPDRVLPSDAETLAAVHSARRGPDVLVHHRWAEVLGRDHLTRRFYRELEHRVLDLAATARGHAPDSVRHELALLNTTRVLFLSFLQAKGWLDEDREYLRHRAMHQLEGGGGLHRCFLEPLFFGTLNTPASNRSAAARALGRIPFLNGGLFARTPIERRARHVVLADDALAELMLSLLGRYRLTAHEEQAGWSEAAVDPEMLGRAFESLMARDERRAAGAFYTPHELIHRVAGAGLEAALACFGAEERVVRAAEAGERVSARDARRLADAVRAVRILDPACGSGAFLVHALERLAALSGAAGDRRSLSLRRRDVLTTSIFGVDINPTAVWLCELRLWLSVVIDAEESDPSRVMPLPNLDRNIRVGDALAGTAFDEAPRTGGIALERLRGRYTRATGVRKRTLARAIDREERTAAIALATRALDLAVSRRRDMLCALRSRDLFLDRTTATAAQLRRLAELRGAVREARRRLAVLRSGGSLPFAFGSHFPDVAARGGFDAIIGNPPWVRLHHIAPADRTDLRARYRVMRDAAWAAGADATGAGRGFAAQADLSALFIERSLALLRPTGTLALLVPAKLWRALAGGGVRQLLAEEATLREIADWSEGPSTFDAVVYPSLVVATRTKDAAQDGTVRVGVARRDRLLAWESRTDDLPIEGTPGAPWALVPPDVRRDFERLAGAGEPLSSTVLGRPLLGVKTGCNDAFLVQALDQALDQALEQALDQALEQRSSGDPPCSDDVCRVAANDTTGAIEQRVLRPVLRGEGLQAWHRPPNDERIIWTHDALGAPLDRLPAGAHEWLRPWSRRLSARTDAQGRGAWWQLFRTDAARTDLPRVVWGDIGRTPRAVVLERGNPAVPLNSCYAILAPSDDDAHALAVLLNAPPIIAWLTMIAEPARGGYHRFLGWTVARLPIPRDWGRAVDRLAPIGRAAAAGSPPDAATHTAAVLASYHLRPRDAAALLTWTHS